MNKRINKRINNKSKKVDSSSSLVKEAMNKATIKVKRYLAGSVDSGFSLSKEITNEEMNEELVINGKDKSMKKVKRYLAGSVDSGFSLAKEASPLELYLLFLGLLRDGKNKSINQSKKKKKGKQHYIKLNLLNIKLIIIIIIRSL